MKARKIRKTNKTGLFHKWWIWLLIFLGSLLVCLIIIAPFIINIITGAFNQDSSTIQYLSAGDILSYIGAILGFLSTVIFSALALWQNHRLSKINEKILENEHRYSSIPQLEISNIIVSYDNAFLPKESPDIIEKNGCYCFELTTHFPEDYDCETTLGIELKNIGDGLAKNLKATYISPDISYETIAESEDASIWTEEDYLRPITKVGQVAYFNFKVPLLMSEQDDNSQTIILEYTNLYDYKYMYYLIVTYDFIESYRFKFSIQITNYDTF